MNLINTDSYELMAPAKATALAANLSAEATELDGDDAWAYTAVHDPKGTGYSFIEIHDEDGEFVSKM